MSAATSAQRRTAEPGRAQRAAADDAILAIAARQHGVVTRAQLVAAGLSPQTVERRVRMKRLRPLHRGVYLAGPVMAPWARVLAAVLACGKDRRVRVSFLARALRERSPAGRRAGGGRRARDAPDLRQLVKEREASLVRLAQALARTRLH